MHAPLVSVVMSVRDGERFLRSAVESILEQTCHDFEFLIIDDGSSDASAAILHSYESSDSRVRVYQQDQRGLVKSLNRGCGEARGKYIARMDADDIAVSQRLQWQVQFMETHPAIAVLGGAVEVIDAAGNRLATHRNPIGDTAIRSVLLQVNPFWHPTVLMRKDVFLSVGGYREVVADAEDYDLWLRIADHFELGNLSAVILKYRLHPHQVTVRKCKQMALSAVAARAAAILRRAGQVDPLEAVTEIDAAALLRLGVDEAALGKALAGSCLWAARNMRDSAQPSAALTLVRQTLKSFRWRNVDRRVIADLRLLAAELYWREGNITDGILSGGRALMTRPAIIGRPLKRIWQRRGWGANSIGVGLACEAYPDGRVEGS